MWQTWEILERLCQGKIKLNVREGGKKIYCLSRDHKPNDEKEYKRIIEAGGKIYQYFNIFI